MKSSSLLFLPLDRSNAVRLACGLGTAALLALLPARSWAATYTYGGATGGTWSTTTNWNPNSPAGGPGSGDTADLFDTATSRTVIYDATAASDSGSGTDTGKLGSLNLTEVSGANNEVQIAPQVGINVSTAITLGATGTNSTVTLDLQGANSTTSVPTALTNSILTVNSGGVLDIGLTGGSMNETFLSGALILNTGGVINTNASVGTSTASPATEVETLGGTGTLTMNGGTMNLNQGSMGAVRLTVGKNFTANSGTINFVGTLTNSDGINQLYLSGTTNTISSGVTISSAGTGLTGNGAEINLNATGNQTLQFASGGTAGADIFDIHERYSSATGTGVKTVQYNGTGTGYIGEIFLNSTTAGGTGSIQLGSNLTTDSSRTVILAKDSNTSAGTLNLDLNGYTLDGSAVAAGLITSGTQGTGLNDTPAGTDSFSITSSTTAVNTGFNPGAGPGTLKATGFVFNAGSVSNALRIAIGPGVVLQAVGTVANDFSSNTPTSGTSSATFDPTSTFYYTGSAATVTTGANTLGIVTVGNGSTASTLTVPATTGTLNTAGVVTINTLGTLLVNGTSTNSAGVSVSGGTLGGTGTVGGAVTMTAGLLTAATAGTIGTPTAASVGVLTLTSSATLSGGTLQVDIFNNVADKLEFTNGSSLGLSGNVTLTINGTLDGTSTYDLADYTSESGKFASTNVPANYTVVYSATELELMPVPEPAASAGCLFMLAGLVGWRQVRRRSASAA